MPKKIVRTIWDDADVLRRVAGCARELIRTQESCGFSISDKLTFRRELMKGDLGMKEILAEEDALRYCSGFLAKYKGLLRQKSFCRLLRVFVQLVFDYYSCAGIYEKVLMRVGSDELELFDFLKNVRAADIEYILHTSRYTSRSYAYLVRIISSLLQRSEI